LQPPPQQQQQQQQHHHQQQRQQQYHHTAGSSVQTGTVMAKSGLVRAAYSTLRSSELCKAKCVVVQAPNPDVFQFPDTAHLAANHRVLYSAASDDITTEEVIFGRVKEQTNKARLNKFIGGRIALRRALNEVMPTSYPHDAESIMRDQWGAPQLSRNITGSISHKDFLCVGAAAVDPHGRVGVDLEHVNNKAATTLWRRILTEEEKAHLGSLASLGYSLEEETLLIFSFKEAVYKAIHPFLARSVDFQEVEILPRLSGKADVRFHLKTGEDFEVDAHWERFLQRYWLTLVYVKDRTLTMDVARTRQVQQ
jgi:4'-phosphopantetheinyl transferase EntD